MKNFLVPVARMCAEIAEMTSNAAQEAWHGRGTDSVAPIERNPAEIPENDAIRRPSELAQRPLSGAPETYSDGEHETRGAPAFDVASFCSELEAWRASLISSLALPITNERQSLVKHDPLAANSRAELAPCGLSKPSASIESDVTRAVRNIERGPIFRPVARPSRNI